MHTKYSIRIRTSLTDSAYYTKLWYTLQSLDPINQNRSRNEPYTQESATQPTTGKGTRDFNTVTHRMSVIAKKVKHFLHVKKATL